MTAKTATPARTYSGPAFLSRGFRPFFLLAAIWAAVAMVIWIALISGYDPLLSAFDPVSWHAHEMLFGYLGAVLAGFLLTSVPNWTGRPPIAGFPLIVLVLLWCAGRFAVAYSGMAPLLAAIVDLTYPIALFLVIGREIISARNARNYPIVVLLFGFATGNMLFHYTALDDGFSAGSDGLRAGLAVAIMLISLVGGRIVPAFTRNWMAQQGQDRFPAQPDRLDQGALILGLVALLLWIVWPEQPVSGTALLLAGIVHALRLSRWQMFRTLPEPLVWVLHVGYGFVPFGFLAIGISVFGGLPAATAQHVWMAGAIGLMTLAVMTRASLGHAGWPLAATRMTVVIYLALIGSVFTRLGHEFMSENVLLLYLSAGLWIIAFGGFAIAYLPILVRPRVS